MNSINNLQTQVMLAARDNGISSVLFRNAIGRKLKLSVTESECLSLLMIKGTSTPTELARYTGLTTGSTTTMLDRLEKATLIRRTPNPNDRRGVLVEISPVYTEMAGPLVAGVQKAHTELLATYSDKELEIIKDFLTRFTGNVTTQTAIIEKDTNK
ncbi:MAG TPA: MarR family transcriptional regulator [Candidatus Saccharimonadales bacterium]|nr:MarR family transcriptional regulator [Candidatus Saccharimonadales bacterium]